MMGGTARFMAGKKVQIAYQGKLTRDVLVTALKSVGVDKTLTGTPSEMLLRAADFQPDLVMCEYAMDQLNGADFIRHLRTEIKVTAPLILVHHRGDQDAARCAREAGVQGVINIPFAVTDVVTALKAVFVPQPKRELRF